MTEQMTLELDIPSMAKQKKHADKVILQTGAVDGSGEMLITQWCNVVTIGEYSNGIYKSVDVTVGLLDYIMERVTRYE